MAESIREVSQQFDGFQRQVSVPSAREWRLHIALFLFTITTTVIAGIVQAAPDVPTTQPALATPIDYLLYVPLSYFYSIEALFKFALTNPEVIVSGATFSAALLAILFSHEMGHYLACRYYGVDATLPFFIPAPPLFLAGTFGAFIKMKSPIPSRRALFDIGLAGPLAGFVMLLPIAVAGILTLQSAPAPVAGGAIIFNDPLLLR